MNINYKIEMHNYWHCGSGLAAGADVDALVVKDKDGLPFIPGKTIKGLIREAVDDIMSMADINKESDYESVFGYIGNHRSDAFFSNVVLSDEEHDCIIKGKLQRFMYDSVSQTAIDEKGIAVEHSLRKTEVVVPCTLYGEILNVPNTMEDVMNQGMKFIKNLGTDRNRGLGRCTITITDITGKEDMA